MVTLRDLLNNPTYRQRIADILERLIVAPTRGTSGIAGIPGERGPAGPRGLTGAPGAQGTQGPAGSDGAQGLSGAKGDTGDQGAQGNAGVDGADGADGAQGIQGPPGVNGADGAQGPAGVKGDTGDTGGQGIQGPPGETGAQGNQGTPGIKGDTGDTGAQGNPGVQGEQGIQGIQGTQGPAGGLGYAVNVQALTSSPADGATIYFGVMPKAPTTTANISKIYCRKAGALKIAEIYCYSGTAGTAEAWSLYIRKNNSADTLIATVSAATSERVFSNAALNIALAIGDYIEIKAVNPTWVTNPLTCIFGGYIYIE